MEKQGVQWSAGGILFASWPFQWMLNNRVLSNPSRELTPPVEWVKANVDGAVIGDEGTEGLVYLFGDFVASGLLASTRDDG